MIDNSCNECIYKIESDSSKCINRIKRLSESPVNLNSILMKNIIKNTVSNECAKIDCCTNENNGYKDFINGKIIHIPCDLVNHYGECRYFKSVNKKEETE